MEPRAEGGGAGRSGGDFEYARASRILAESLDAFLPPDRISVAEYAAEHRFLANEGGGYVGRWSHEQAPYLVGPMECLNSLLYTTTCLVGPAQCGKTSVAENWLLQSVGCDPADFLWYMQTDAGLEAYVKKSINGMVAAHDILKNALGMRSVDDSLHFKHFGRMTIEFLSATYANLIGKRAPRLVLDEIDAYAPSLGDVKALVDFRRQTYGDESMLLATSHCDRATGLDPAKDWRAGIMAIYADSDRRIWYWQCPHCGAVSSPCPIAPRYMAIDYPEDGTLDEIEAKARLVCPVNGCIIEDRHRRAMNLTGRWIGDGQVIHADGTVTGELVPRKTAGFWIVGAMSPFIMGGIGGLARARVKAEREQGDSAEEKAAGEEDTLRTVIVKGWGFPYQAPRAAGSLDANTLADRAEPDLALGQVATGVRFLTAAVDIQAAYFEVLVRGWGVRGESWIVDHFRLPETPDVSCDPATRGADWDQLLNAVVHRRYPLADGSGRVMAIRGVGFDSAGLPGVTEQAYDAWRRWKQGRHVKNFGMISGRDVFSVIPMKGGSVLRGARLAVVYPDTQRRDRDVARRGDVPLAIFNPNLFKDDVAGQLKGGIPGPGYVHFPASLRQDAPPHPWFEQLTSETRSPQGRWEKERRSARNEVLDLMVMSHAVANLHGLKRLDWARPPLWAAEWDKNSTVTNPGAAGEATPRPAAVSPTLAGQPIAGAAASPAAPVAGAVPIGSAEPKKRGGLARLLPH